MPSTTDQPACPLASYQAHCCPKVLLARNGATRFCLLQQLSLLLLLLLLLHAYDRHQLRLSVHPSGCYNAAHAAAECTTFKGAAATSSGNTAVQTRMAAVMLLLLLQQLLLLLLCQPFLHLLRRAAAQRAAAAVCVVTLTRPRCLLPASAAFFARSGLLAWGEQLHSRCQF
jgi:hypothetical protein